MGIGQNAGTILSTTMDVYLTRHGVSKVLIHPHTPLYGKRLKYQIVHHQPVHPKF